MLSLVDQGIFNIETVVEKMCHAPATIFKIEKRGYISEGYYADLALLSKNNPWTVSKETIQSKCGWSPFEGTTFNWKVDKTFINGHLTFNDGVINSDIRGKKLKFK